MHDSSTEVPTKLDRIWSDIRAGAYDARVAKAANDAAIESIEQQRLATVVVTVRGGLQEAWSRREEMGTSSYEALATAVPPVGTGQATLSYRQVDGNQPVERIRCTHCQIRPGFGPCPRCTGVGVLIVQQPGGDNSNVIDCPACEDGFATCTVCDGSQQSVVATLRYVTIKPFATNHVIPCTCRDALLQVYPETVDPPASLVYDVESPGGQSAYRGNVASAEREYHGYAFGDTVKQARAFVRRVQAAPSFLIDTLRAYAFPYILASFAGRSQTHRVVFFVDADGNPSWVLL
jgi:hypothetical protein